MKIMYIQYAGDFAAAFNRLFIENKKENYYGQHYSVQTVLNQANKGHIVHVLTTIVETKYSESLTDNLSASGIDKSTSNRHREIFKQIQKICPDTIILRMPDWRILRYIYKHKIPVFPIFADSFQPPHRYRFRAWLGYKLLSKELKRPHISWIANHQINAAKSILYFGVPADRILPYDWQHPETPENWEPNIAPDIETKKIRVFYAGRISESKGVFDAIKSIALIQQSGKRQATLRIAGTGEKEEAERKADNLNIAAHITFLGLITHKQVLKEMNSADIVIVPSHHSYPEGLPMTIMEGLMVHTPVIVSNHPMFMGRLLAGQSVEFFEEKNCHQLAETIIHVCGNKKSYSDRCKDAPQHWKHLTLPLKWADMINAWLDNSNSLLLQNNTLTNYL